MKKVILKIESIYDSETITLKEEVSIGRTNLADVVLDDAGLSSINTTIFRDGNDVLIVDEGSTNGTFINGERVGSTPKILFDGDLITCGSDTQIEVVFGEKKVLDAGIIEEKKRPKKPQKTGSAANAPKTVQKYTPDIKLDDKETSWIMLVAAGSTFLIIFLAVIGIILANYFELDKTEQTESRRLGPQLAVNKNAVIPIQVIDPLGGQEQEDLEELTQYWEVQEDEIKVEDLETIDADTSINKAETGLNLNVKLDYWKKQYDITRAKVYGNDPPGRILRKELCCGVPKQTAKIREMQQEGYKIPMDFADLARKRMAGELIELPMATEYWVLDVGGSSNTNEFTTFDFESGSKVAPPGSDDYNTLATLAANFSGVKYDMNNPTHRQQMKIRLLRMFHPRALPILQKLSKAYQAKFGRPLRITSLARSMEYQIGLNKFNPNSFRVRGAGSLPPHTSGCAFDLSRKFQSAEEQNFMSNWLADTEQNEKTLDALREGNVNACFHVFIYDDGQPPAGF
jgi:hypothetical protein